MRTRYFQRVLSGILLTGVGICLLSRVFQAWLGIDMLLALANGAYGCG